MNWMNRREFLRDSALFGAAPEAFLNPTGLMKAQTVRLVLGFYATDEGGAEKAYRDTRLAYLNLIGSYLTTAAQMNMAAGREVIQ